MSNRMVYIEWLDSCSPAHADWYENDSEIDGTIDDCLTPIESCGIVLKETEQVIMLASSKTTERFHGAICIPKCAVRIIRELAFEQPPCADEFPDCTCEFFNSKHSLDCEVTRYDERELARKRAEHGVY